MSLEEFFPSEVVVRVGDPDRVDGPLLGDEGAAIERAIEKRRREFTAGRVLAREALDVIGIAPTPVPVGEDRAPRWPAEVIGSITHTRGFCAVAVARRSPGLIGIGIDVEPDEALAEAVLERIALPAEIERLRAAGDALHLGRRLFCAKEALYKAQYPETREFLGFRDVEIALDVATGAFTAATVGTASERVDLNAVTGRVFIVGGRLVAGALASGALSPTRRP